MKRRSWLFVPGNDMRKIEKALASETDIVIIDFEDAVAPAEKAIARQIVNQSVRKHVESVQHGKTKGDNHAKPLIFVRLNGIKHEACTLDLKCCADVGIRHVVLPKTESSSDIAQLHQMWTQFSKEPLYLIALIETALGVEQAYEIAKSHPAVQHLALGSADLSLDLGIELDAEQDELLYTRSRLVIASRAAGIQPPIDAVYMDIKNEQGFLIQASRAKKMGFAGKMIIHPAHISLVHRVWEEDTLRIEKDYRIKQAFEQALQEGIAAIQVDGQMVDNPIYQSAVSRIRLHEGKSKKEES